MKLYGYVVTVKGPGDEDRMQYEQQFRCEDFGQVQAKAKALANVEKMRRLWGRDYRVHLITCPTKPCGVG